MIYHRHFKLRLSYFDKSYEQLIFKQHTSRLDAPENVIRSKYSRLTKVNIPPTNNFNQYRYKETSRLIIRLINVTKVSYK